MVVVGGGPAGIAAAVASARAGADTLLVERYGFLGGMMTAGLVNSVNGFRNQGDPSPQAVAGIALEFVKRMESLGGAYLPEKVPYCVIIEPEAAKKVAVEMVQESGASLLVHTLATSPIKEGNKCSGVVVENKSGRRAIPADVVVDCTGDGDMAARCGASYQTGRSDDGKTLPAQMLFKLDSVDLDAFSNWVYRHKSELKPLYDIEPLDKVQEAAIEGRPFGVSGLKMESQTFSCVTWRDWALFWATEPVVIDGTRGDGLSKAEEKSRSQVWSLAESLREIPGFENSHLQQSAVQLGVRETRRITGEYIIDKEDVLEGSTFEDSVAVGANPMACLEERRILNHPGFEIPFRCLLPREIEGIVTAGRCISTTHEAHGSTRAIATCMATGEASGAAASLSIGSGVIPRHLSIPKLREHLGSQGAIINVVN